jgi:hypothetical protein
MALAFIENGAITKYPIGLVDVRRKFPNTSFPRKIESGDLSVFGVVTIQSTPLPSFDPNQQKVEAADPAQIDGVWQEVWNVVDLTAEEIQEKVAGKASQVRGTRNELLNASDWTQVSDSPVDTAAWAAYRAELRAVPEQAGFPDNVVWPTAPSN